MFVCILICPCLVNLKVGGSPKFKRRRRTTTTRIIIIIIILPGRWVKFSNLQKAELVVPQVPGLIRQETNMHRSAKDQYPGFDPAILWSFFSIQTMLKSQYFSISCLSFLMRKDKHLKTKMYARCLKIEIISSKCFNHAVENHFLQWPNHINHSKRLKTKFNCTNCLRWFLRNGLLAIKR